ncbi:MAG: M1 family aminopeptidase [bacterium]|nr:M1 family aminopeptidase [bacterium]
MLTRLILIVFGVLLCAGILQAQYAGNPDCYRELFDMHEARGPAQSALDNTDDETAYDALHYDLYIRFFPADSSVSGQVYLRFASTVASLSAIDLNLYSGMTVDSVRVAGTVVTYILLPSHILTVNLPQPLPNGDSTTAQIYYHGRPYLGSGEGVFFDLHLGHPLINSLSEAEGARNWWPCKDRPGDKATARMVWTVPDDIYATSNGLLQNITTPEPGWKTFDWVETYPISTYLIAVTATNYAHWRDWYVTTAQDSMPLDHYIYPEDSVHSRIDFADLPEVIGWFASVWEEYPFLNEKYGHAEFPWGGAMEHQTLTSYGEDLITGNNSYHWIMVHELSHMWWGDLVTCGTWMDIWLNEGFATYADALWIEHAQGENAFYNRLLDFRQTYMQWEGYEGRFPIYNPDYMWGGTVYQKGAWILHMLRYVMGETDFWNFYTEWRARYSFSSAVTADLQQTMQDVSGLDLTWFFDEWVYMAGYPEYRWGWEAEPISGEDSSRVDLSVLQVQQLVNQTPIFTMPLPFRVITSTGQYMVQLWNAQPAQLFNFNVRGIVTDVIFDPEYKILKNATETGYSDAPTTSPWALPTKPDLTLSPNPANPTVRISFELPTPQHAVLQIYNLAGQKVAELLNGSQPAGTQTFTWDGSAYASGIYLVRLETPSVQLVKKLTVLK